MKRDWTLGMACVALCAALVAAGAVWVMWTADPVLTLLAGIWAAMTGLCVLAATRNLRARLENAERLLDAWNSSEARDELAKSPPGGVQKVELYDQAAEEPVVAYWPLPDSHIQVNPSTRAADSRWLGPNEIVWPENPLTVHINPEPMTVAETDRLVAQLQALPDEGCICPWDDAHERLLARYPSCPIHRFVDESPETWSARFAERQREAGVEPIRRIIGGTVVRGTGIDDQLGQPCARCDAPSTAWVSDRPDPEIRDVTFLCDGCYAERMSEEDGRG